LSTTFIIKSFLTFLWGSFSWTVRHLRRIYSFSLNDGVGEPYGAVNPLNYENPCHLLADDGNRWLILYVCEGPLLTTLSANCA